MEDGVAVVVAWEWWWWCAETVMYPWPLSASPARCGVAGPTFVRVGVVMVGV